MSIVEPVMSQEQKQEVLDYVNMYRAKHNAPAIEYDDEIATFSQGWAKYLTQTGLFQHSNNRDYGENLAYFKGYGNNVMELIKKSIDLWYEEIKLYDYNNPGFSSETGHFTCLIWKEQTKMGIGYAYNPITDVVNVSQNVSPPCNWMGKFEENVLPLKEEIPEPIPVPIPAPEPTPEPVPVPIPAPEPTPEPVPEPTPEPVPEPTTEPVPEPTPSPEEEKEQIIKLLENLIHLLRSGYNRRVLLGNLDIIINELFLSGQKVPETQASMLNKLYYAKYLLESRMSLYTVFVVISKILMELKMSQK